MKINGYQDWKEAMLQLPERTFFLLMRLYLGEIKTPFNKQRLVESLGGFLSKPETQRTMIESLDRLDLLILTAVHTLPVTNRGSLLIFLSSETALQTRLTNLEERLVLYRDCYTDDYDRLINNYRINPFLYKSVEPLLDAHSLFLPQREQELQSEATLCDDIVLAGLYTFFLKETDVLKMNGAFKVKAEKQLKAVFQDAATDIGCFKTLCTGLQNLGLLIVESASLTPQQGRWEEFFKQKPFDRKMYTIAAVYGHARRESMQKRAQFFSDFLTSLDPHGLYDDIALKRFFDFLFLRLHAETNGDVSIFPDMMIEDELRMIDTLKALKFLLPVGEYWQLNTASFNQESVEQPLIAAPSFEITMLPFTALGRIFPVLSCMEPVSILTTGRFTITRAACLRCFERCCTDKALIALLEEASGGIIPQNIKVSISEWYLQCTAVGLYYGFVITVAEEKRKLFKQNAGLQDIIYKELADGVYLIKQMDLDSVRMMIKSAGLDVTFYTTGGTGQYTAAGFASIEYRHSALDRFDKKAKKRRTIQCKQKNDYSEHIRELQAVVDTMPIDQYNKQGLKEKIAKKLIITKEQLNGAPTDNGVREVSGLDFLGKIHLAETAIADNSRLEVSIDGVSGRRIIVGVPIAIEKTEHDALLVIQEDNTQCKEKISIAGIIKMRSFRSSFFS
ncbi:hypothetical protein [Treponema sp. OMZ 805]|uniref:hypothetical protein n=1 Tax=Treponema sp. OMZ 805 TaxID=2726068 RepID=UPI003D8B7F86